MPGCAARPPKRSDDIIGAVQGWVEPGCLGFQRRLIAAGRGRGGWLRAVCHNCVFNNNI